MCPFSLATSTKTDVPKVISVKFVFAVPFGGVGGKVGSVGASPVSILQVPLQRQVAPTHPKPA